MLCRVRWRGNASSGSRQENSCAPLHPQRCADPSGTSLWASAPEPARQIWPPLPKLCPIQPGVARLCCPSTTAALPAVSWAEQQRFEDGQIALLSSSKYPYKSDIFKSQWKY